MATAKDSNNAKKAKAGSAKRFKIVIAALVIVIGLGSFGIAYALGQHNGNSNAATCQGSCIYLRSEGATPDTMTVTAGSSVEFTAADGKKHNLSLVEHGHGGDSAAHEDAAYQSGDFAADEAWRVQFKQDGTFTFVDKYNPKTKISVLVYTPGKDYKVE